MNAPRVLSRLALAAALALASRAAQAQTCTDPAARDLLAASYLDTVLNPPVGEDLDFLMRDSGLPNIMVLFDSSGSMRRLPPNGPAFIGGLNPTLPPGHLLLDPNDSTQQAAAYNDTSRVVGCGLDPVSAALPGFMSSDTFTGITQRWFHPPCGAVASAYAGLLGTTYQGQAWSYANAMTVCPYFTSSNNQATGAPGFDPDFYNNAGPTATTANGAPVFFGSALVFHDTIVDAGTYAYSNTLPFGHNFGDGWTDLAVYPYQRATNQIGSITDFCAAQGTVMQGTMTRQDVCNQCLTTAGWYYDGIILQKTQDGIANKQYPSLWYTGNYLNFFPPKFLIARKIVKDVIAVQSKVRMALSDFTATGATVFQQFNPDCGHPDSNFDSNRASYVSGLNSPTNLSFNGGTPLSWALFGIGQYYHSPSLPWFGSSWYNSSLASSSTKTQYSICFSCQVSTVLLLTDGVPSPNDGTTLPPNATTIADTSGKYAGDPSTGILGIDATTCPQCGTFSGTSDYLNNLPRVAWYLNNMDLRKNTEGTVDCMTNGGKQTINTYTIGFGTGQLGPANAVLRNAADAGGGIFVPAEDPSQLKDGINLILQDISNRSTSFSVATVSTLQTTSGRAVIVPRFSANKTAHWKGHLYRFDLYSEFVNACTPGGAGDLDCDGKCVSTFLSDNSGSDAVTSLISEDGNGEFVRNDTPTEPLCTQAPACQASGTCTVPGNAAAKPFWDAGDELAKQSWKTRNVWTVVDSNGDGVIDASDTPVQLTTATDTAATALIPYLALGTSATGQSVCASLADLLNSAGDIASATRVASSKLDCAKTVIRYLLGADVLNSLGKKAPDWPVADPETLWDREFKLGDIFHSSPVVVDPPLPRDGILCRNGLSNQCISSLWGTPTPDGETGYDAYSKSAQYQNRRKVILVGANDGLLHAFNGGRWIANPTPGVHNPIADDPFTTAVDESLPPFNGYYERGNLDGAKELWAFLPPDMIAKLPLLMGAQHQFFVDGTAMVRDVWVDGTSNALGPGTSPQRKEGGEFHTVAVVGERRGGTRYFALDVTDATEFGTHPSFLWLYPQPKDRRSLELGNTYDDFLPVPPPVGPVRVEADTVIANVTPSMTVPGASAPVPYKEVWVAFLSGGFDPQYLRGRGVYMVDVWTGKEIFQFAYPRDPTTVSSSDPRLGLRFPIAATIGMVPWGQAAERASNETNDRFFDTATFGDAGGQLWVIRFNTPGHVATNGYVDNWFGARIFQMGNSGACMFCGGQPFFYPTANMALPTNLAFRVFAGTGDRFNLLDTNGGVCGPDNLRACALLGCTVSLAASSNFLSATGPGVSAMSLSETACGALSGAPSDGTLSSCAVGGESQINITCPGGVATTKDIQAGCVAQADGYRCALGLNAQGSKVTISSSTINLGNAYLSLLVFEDLGARAIFTTAAGAASYDQARLFLNQTGATTATASPGIVLMDASDNAPATVATATSKGWAILYDHSGSISIDNAIFTTAWQDERTSSPSAAGEGLITWNSTQPPLSAQANLLKCNFLSKCTAVGRRISYHYAADPETGAPFQGFTVGNQVVRSIASTSLVPTTGDQTTVFVNQQGQVAVGLTAVNPEKGATNVGMGDPVDPTMDLGFVEVGEQLHACRHEATPTCR